jgi:predicted dehydrogenase
MTAPLPLPDSGARQHSFATLGVGRHGLGVIEHLLGTGRWQMLAGIDPSAAAYARFQYQFHEARIPFYTTAAEALAATQPEVIHIAATAPAHVPLAKAVLETGFTGKLLIEKPIATSLCAAEGLLDELRKLPAGSAAVNFNRRCARVYHSAWQVIQSGELGRVQHIDYKRSMKLSMKGSHYIDLINWYMGARPKCLTAELAPNSEVDARGAYFYDPPGYLEIEYAGGQSACLDGLGRRSDLAEGMSLQLEQGRIEIDVREKITRLSGPQGERTLADDSKLTLYHWIENTFLALAEPGGAFTACSPAEAIDSLAVIVAAYQSSQRAGQPVQFPLSDGARAEVLRLA